MFTRTTTRWAVLLVVGSSLLMFAAASPARSAKPTAAPHVSAQHAAPPYSHWRVKHLRQVIVSIRSQTQRTRVEIGLSRLPQSHAASRTISVPYLFWIKHHWQHALGKVKRIVRGGPKAYARLLVAKRWPGAAEWQATNNIIVPESGWNPCASYPGNHDCSYAGVNACGVAQRDPCPLQFQGQLWATRWAQVRDLVAYIASRYGDPQHAWYVKQTTGIY